MNKKLKYSLVGVGVGVYTVFAVLATMTMIGASSVANAGPYVKYKHTIDYVNKNKEDSAEQIRLGYEVGNFYVEGGAITNHLDKGVGAEMGYFYELVDGFTFDFNWEGTKRDNYNDVIDQNGSVSNVGSNKTFHQIEMQFKYNF